jgi:Contact-dependent growth inhibition CdiA C-terminal domain
MKTYQLLFTAPNGGTMEVHEEHFTEELAENQFFGLVLALAGKHVRLRPYSYVQNVKNPDAEIDGQVVDFKFPRYSKNPHQAIQQNIKEANGQGASIAVIYLGNPNIEQNDIRRALIAALQAGWNRRIQSVWLIYPNLVLLEIPRNAIEDKSFIEHLP